MNTAAMKREPRKPRRGDKFNLSWIEGTCVITCVRKGIVYFMSPHDSWQMPLETFTTKVQNSEAVKPCCETCKPSTPAVSASPAPVCRICHWRKNYHMMSNGLFVCPTNGPFNNPLLTFEAEDSAAQPVAANPKEVMPTATDAKSNTFPRSSGSVTEASLKTSGLANPPKVEEIAKEIIALESIAHVHQGVIEDIAAILGPFFTQVSQPPERAIDYWREHCNNDASPDWTKFPMDVQHKLDAISVEILSCAFAAEEMHGELFDAKYLERNTRWNRAMVLITELLKDAR